MFLHQNLIFLFGRPFSPIYSAIMRLREQLYLRGFFKSIELEVPVISVGNIVLGGTGKTPTVKYLAEFLKENGYKPAIISRGYKGVSKRSVNVVSDGQNVLMSAVESGDEPYMLATTLQGVPVLTGVVRAIPCKYAIDHFGADVLILDDGFQHLKVKRQIDLVLFDGTFLAGNSRVFPGGVLREPVTALQRCSSFLMTGRTDQNSERIDKFKALLNQKFPDKPVYTSGIKATHDFRAGNKEEGLKIGFAFCGIANPDRFKNTLRTLGLTISGFKEFSDHAVYSQNIVNKLCLAAKESGALFLVTTEKDYVKVKHFSFAMPLAVVSISGHPEKDFERYLHMELTQIFKNFPRHKNNT